MIYDVNVCQNDLSFPLALSSFIHHGLIQNFQSHSKSEMHASFFSRMSFIFSISTQAAAFSYRIHYKSRSYAIVPIWKCRAIHNNLICCRYYCYCFCFYGLLRNEALTLYQLYHFPLNHNFFDATRNAI